MRRYEGVGKKDSECSKNDVFRDQCLEGNVYEDAREGEVKGSNMKVDGCNPSFTLSLGGWMSGRKET